MKLLQKLFVFLAVLAVAATSCQKEVSDETGNGSVGTGQWEFKEGTSGFKGPVDTAYITEQSGIKTLFVEGVSEDKKDEFFLQVFGTSLTTGNYTGAVVYFEYFAGSSKAYSSDPTTTTFTVIITAIDSAAVTGTFSGEVKDATGAVKTIKEGKFTGKFITVAPPPPGNGQVTFWSKQGCTAGAELVVQVDGKKDTITAFNTSGPTCGAAGTAFFTLPAGTYAWKAYCVGSTDTTTGSTVITSGDCISEEVVIGGVVVNPNTCKLSNIGYFDLPTGIGFWAHISQFSNTNTVTNIKYIDSSTNPATVAANFNISTTFSKVNIDGTQYFSIGPGGAVSLFHGYLDPTDNTSGDIEWKYTYDASGYMTKAACEFIQAPGVPFYEITNTWVGGNLVQVKMTELITNTYSVVAYTYDNAKPAKNFLFLGGNYEITLFQSAINYGKVPASLPIKSTYQEYQANGTPTGAAINSDFKNYTYDANGNVHSFEHAGDGSFLVVDTKYVLTYKCF